MESEEEGSIAMRFFLELYDYLEQFTMGMAHTILVDSKHTQDIFRVSYPLLMRRRPEKLPKILYPFID